MTYNYLSERKMLKLYKKFAWIRKWILKFLLKRKKKITNDLVFPEPKTENTYPKIFLLILEI